MAAWLATHPEIGIVCRGRTRRPAGRRFGSRHRGDAQAQGRPLPPASVIEARDDPDAAQSCADCLAWGLLRALACGADPLHISSVFGLDTKTAIHYADSARALLTTTTEEQDPARSDEPKDRNHP